MGKKDILGTRMTEKMILIGFVLAILFWLLESILAAFAFQKGSFLSQLFSTEPYQLWIYCLVLSILVIFGGYAQAIIIRLKETDRALRESEAKYSALVENAKDGVVIIQNDTCKFANKAMAEITGYQVDKIPGVDFSQFLLPESKELINHIQKNLSEASTPPLNHEATIRYTDGTLKELEISFSIIQYHGKPAVMGIARDITDRKRAEHQLKKQAKELERSNAELEQFAYVASHDLQEPLRMVSSYVKLLERRYKGKLDSDADDFIYFASDGATRMYRLINDLLAYSRVSSQGRPFEQIDSSEALYQALANLQASILETRADIVVDTLPTIIADGSQLTQLLQNLIGNAIKFHDGKPPVVHISAKEEDNQWLFSVKDNGIGIDPKYAERIFVIFQRLHDKSEYPGTGIGLAICKKIVERHNGRIWVESKPKKGSTFYFTIPKTGGNGQ